MDDVIRPSAVRVDVRYFDHQRGKRGSVFLNEFRSLVCGGGEVGFKSEVAVPVAFHPDEIQPLWFRAGVDELEDIVIRYQFWQRTVGFHD